jgi:hypothetical protein
MPKFKSILIAVPVCALVAIAVALIANVMAFLLIALLIVVVRLSYIARFGYRSPLYQPMKYAKVKKILTIASVISVWIAATALIFEGSIVIASVFVLGCLVAGHVIRFKNYARAVTYHSEMRDSTGAYVLTGSWEERDATARMIIDSEIDSGHCV